MPPPGGYQGVYSYPPPPPTQVLSNPCGTKFVVGTSLSHCIFMFIRRKRICDFPNWKIEMKPFFNVVFGELGRRKRGS
ncbi:hypothetical protein PVAP13_7KG202205 [Panicum virgatum]|uniref:Uncharacterized protein n=1 Tax=Panicum virgatum TaxID=38727 RepID=A0A8T0QJ19_PANVG|nr:hypothetical protein PVAP13_7KG202205 [Panicum virgatum]